MVTSEPKGFSVRIYVPSGKPEGLRVIEKSNWNGQGIVFPRSAYNEAKDHEILGRTGVYILWGLQAPEERPLVYIGEGDVLSSRLSQHQAQKDFWTSAVAFTSKDRNLNKAHVQYLEAVLVDLAKSANRCSLDNANSPNKPQLAEVDKAEANLYLDDILLCLPVVGVNFFEKLAVSVDEQQMLYLNSKGISARGYLHPDGFVVKAGSRAVKDEVSSIHAYLSNKRSALLDEKVFQEEGAYYRITKDTLFNSPSNAAGVLLGHSSNGREEWKDSRNRSLNQIQSSEEA